MCPPPEIITYAMPRDPAAPQKSDEGYIATIQWLPALGVAFGAALVPMIDSPLAPGRVILRSGNEGVRRPSASQVVMSWHMFDPLPAQAIARTTLMAWPAVADVYLLLLILKSANPDYPSYSNKIKRLSTSIELLIVPPTEREAKEAAAWYLRERDVMKNGEGMIKR